MANGSANIFDLAAKISVDASQSDRTLDSQSKKVVDLAKRFQDTENKVVAANRKMAQSGQSHAQSLNLQGQAVGRFAGTVGGDLQGAVSNLLPGMGALFGAGSALAAAPIVLAGAAKGIVELATHASEFGSKIYDMSQKVNFSAVTLSSLKVGAELSGVSLESLSTALGIFDRNLEDAHDKTSEQAKVFKALKIDIDDNEKALRQAFTALANAEQGYQQTALAMKLFGRRGKEVLGIIKETGGDLDQFIAKMSDLGLVLSDDAAKKADAFGDKLTVLQNKFDAIVRMIGTELIPVVEKAADDAMGWMQANQGELQKTAKDIATVVEWVYKLAKAVADNSALVIAVRLIRTVEDSVPGASFGRFVGPGNPFAGGPATVAPEGEFAIAGGAGQYSIGAGPPRIPRPRINLGGGGGGRGGGGRDPAADQKRLIDIQTRIALEGLNREEDDIERSYDKRRLVVEVYERALSRLEEEHHKIVVDGLKSEEDAITKSKKLTKLQLSVALQELELKKIQEANRHRQAEYKLEDAILKITRERYVTAERLAGLTTRPRRAEEDIGGVTRPRRTGEDIGGLTRPRIATDAEAAARERYKEFLDRAHQAAANITNILDRALYEGLTGGGLKGGLAALGKGLLDIVEQYFLNRLEQGLFEIFAKIGEKGGIWGKIFGVASGAIGGGFVGGTGAGGIGGIGTVLGGAGGIGSAFAGAFASGGTIPMGQWGFVHEGERVIAGPRGAKVIPSSNRSGGGNITINFHVTAPGGQISRETQTQMARTASRALQKVMLTG